MFDATQQEKGTEVKQELCLTNTTGNFVCFSCTVAQAVTPNLTSHLKYLNLNLTFIKLRKLFLSPAVFLWNLIFIYVGMVLRAYSNNRWVYML